MVEHPELWVYLVVNAVLFLFGSTLAGLSYVAYRQSDGQSSYLFASLGFGFLVLGGLVEPLYRFLVVDIYALNAEEVLLFQIGEGALIAFGLGSVFYAIVQYNSGASSIDADHPTSIDEDVNRLGDRK